MYVIKPKQVRLFFDICWFYVDSISVCHASIGWICKQNRFAVSWWLDLYVYGLSNKYGNHNVSWVHKNIPEELEEAATIDGCGSIRLFISIVLPLMRTIIITVAVINVMGTWNDFLLPSLIINKQGLQTLPLKTYLFFGQFAKRWDLASAGLVMCMAPIIIFYLFSQKYIVKGITEGAIK